MTSTAATLAIQSSPVSFISQLLKGATANTLASQQSSLQTLNVESLQVLKSRLHSGTASVTSSTSGTTSSRPVPAADPASLTWINIQTSLPPSGQGHSAEVSAVKSSHSALLAEVATLCDDERDSSALAETAGAVYRLVKGQAARELVAREKEQAANATTKNGADNYSAAASATPQPASAELLAELKSIHQSTKKELEQAIGGRITEVAFKRVSGLVQNLVQLQEGMHAKYAQLRLTRELKNLPDVSDSSNSNGTLFIPKPRDTSLPNLPLLEEEFGAALLNQGANEQALRALRTAFKKDVAVKADKPALSLTPARMDSDMDEDDSFFAVEEDSELDDLYVGESEDDGEEREAARLAALSNQSVRTINEGAAARKQAATASSTEPLETPTNPVGWWTWLVRACDPFVTYNEAGLPIVSSGEIATQILGVLQSSRPDVQNELLDTVGFEGLDLLATLIKHRTELRAITATHQQQARQTEKQRAEALSQETHRGSDGKIVRGLVGISIHSAADIEATRNRKRADRRMARRSAREGPEDRFAIDEAKLEAQASSLKSMINSSATQLVSQLPPGSTRVMHKGFEEVMIPAKEKVEIKEEELLSIEKSFEPFAPQAFPRMKTLNRMQSKVYQSAYHQNNNLLICAPTGAGKTNVAMMCILREISANIVDGVLKKDQFKMVYVAPMKALAQEVQATFQARLAPLGIIVKELTGDMQLTKKELDETQLVVTTPEKYDVVSRKNSGDSGSGGGGAGFASLIKLLILDEVHLLNEDRGPVLEVLVARTLRLVETSQQMCRIVGLSATLPNYLDVGVFLNASPQDGLFHFDQTYRPVPLSQTFVGVTEPNQMKRLTAMNEVCYKKVIEAVREGHQVMVFVHSRRDTVKTAKFLIEAAGKEKTLPFFDASKDPAYPLTEKKIMRSRNTDLTDMFRHGFGCHHAGMIRPDRATVEEAFAKGLIKVLVCTATLAWGVNLPARRVILKGTQIYNAEKGGFQDVGMLDIQQIFGRAGRPQFDDQGEAVMICEHDKLNRYLSLLTHQLPIESQFIKELPNHLNAEIILGTVTNLNEAVEWLSYTYLYTRMLRNPMTYGISYDEIQFDELLVQHRQKLIIEAAKMLMRCRMIKFDAKSGQFYSTDVGRVASHYYLHYESIELYNTLLQPIMNDEEILNLLAASKEFTQIKTREEELRELEQLVKRYVPVKIKGGLEGPQGKQNLLLQAYISNAIIDAPTLISDSYFIQQSAGRICRALFEMVLRRGKAFLASKFLSFAKMIEHKIWEFQSPLRQFLGSGFQSTQEKKSGPGSGGGQTGGLLKIPTIMKLEEKGLKIDQLVEMDAQEINAILKHNTLGGTVKQCLSYIPYLSVEAKIQPITRTVLKIDMILRAEFTWSDRQHGSCESFWIWIEDTNNEHIYHSENFLLHKRQMGEEHKLTFTIPTHEPLPAQIFIKITSDRWMGSENVHALSFKHLILPELYPANTELLDLHPLPRSALMNAAYEKLYEHKFTHFNPIQTQIFHTLYHTDENILLGAPTGSGKTIVSELAMLRLFSMYPGQKVVYIAPLKALARERVEDWTGAKSFKGLLGKKIVELTGDTAPDQRAILESDIIITTPEKWDGISRNWSSRKFVGRTGLVIIDEIHLLGADRGPVLEVIVSRMRYISSHTASPIRIVGLSTALSNAKDLGDWLGIERAGLFNFPPSVRPVPLTIHISGFAGKHYCPRMATMNKPTYAAIQTHSPKKPVLVFVSSRRQTRLTALDLIAFSAADGDPRKWLHLSEASLQAVLKQVTDPNLRHMISFGIGMHHAGLSAKDRSIVEKLYLDQKIQILVCTSTLAWGVNFPAHLCVVKGTEFYDAQKKRYVDFPITDLLQMIGRAGRPQFDTTAVAVVLVHEPKKNYYLNFLHSPFPVESSLLTQLHDHVNAEICSSGTIMSVSDFLDYLSWTFFFRRLLLNPSYYGLEGIESDVLNKYLMELVVRILGDLEAAGLILQDPDTRSLVPLTLGKIASFYYLNYRTMMVFSEQLRPDSSVQDLLAVLSQVKEYEELPVRHNEDKMNAELNSSMRWPIDTTSFDSPFTKTHMLLQAHLSRLEMPISDYYLDLKSVLDQAIRVLQAMVDTTCEAGWLSSSLHAMNLMQMIVQGRWNDDPNVLNLPGVDHSEKLQVALRTERLDNIVALSRADRGKVAAIARKAHLSEKEVTDLLDALSRMPQVKMSLGSSPPSAASSDASSKSAAGAISPLPTHLPAGSSFILHVSLHRTNANPNVRILTPVFSKPKDEGWWIVVGLSSHHHKQPRDHLVASPQDELIAMKRVNGLKTKQQMTIRVTLPFSVGTHYFSVYLVSDSYLGFDQQMQFEVHTTPPTGASASSSAASAAAPGDVDDIYN